MKHKFLAIHGGFGAGKSWLAHTAPGPRLALDTEGGSWDVEHEGLVRRLWVPGAEPLPTDLTENTSVTVDITKATQLEEAIDWLAASSDDPFESVIVDSFVEAQKQSKRRVAAKANGHYADEAYDPDAVFDQQAWGRLLNNGEYVLSKLRDLTRPTAKRPRNVVLVLPSDIEAVPIRPLLQGATRKHFPGYIDLMGYLMPGTDESGNEQWGLAITPTEKWEAKCRAHSIKQHYGPFIINPNLSEILSVIATKGD